MKNIFYLAFLLLTLIISSCGTYAYKSVSAKTPLLSKQNDFVGQLSLGGSGGEIYAAYAGMTPAYPAAAAFAAAGSAASSIRAISESTSISPAPDSLWCL